MTIMWAAVPGILLAGAPLVLRGLVRASREVAATRASIEHLVRDVQRQSGGLRDAAGELQHSVTAFRENGTLRSRLRRSGDPPVA